MITELCGTDQVHPRVTFGSLLDDVLLEIFDFYLARINFEQYRFRRHPEDAWHTLVHVCKRWRSIVFASPHRLQLQLLCTCEKPVHNSLDIWPELPIIIGNPVGLSKPQDENNIIAALKQHNRVREINMEIPNLYLTRMAAEMSRTFSALTSLQLSSTQINAPALSDSFLGGSAPRLQTFSLTGIPFPALPKLLLSTHDLVALRLWNIPISGYFSPEALVTCLSALTRLEHLRLEFQFPRSRADREHRLVPRQTRVVLPALTSVNFKGDGEYLEDIVAQIDTPLLTWFRTTFFNQLIFDTPSLRHFINHTATFEAPRRARVTFWEGVVRVELYRRNKDSFHEISSLAILCRPSDWQLSSVAQVCDSALSTLPTLERLEINIMRSWKDEAEGAQWVELLQPFASIKDILLHDDSIRHVAPALERLAGETEALPTLQNIFLEGPQPSKPVKKMIGKFVAARQLSGRPVAVHLRGWPGHDREWQQMHWEVEVGD
jgi:hypothetical protein